MKTDYALMAAIIGFYMKPIVLTPKEKRLFELLKSHY